MVSVVLVPSAVLSACRMITVLSTLLICTMGSGKGKSQAGSPIELKAMSVAPFVTPFGSAATMQVPHARAGNILKSVRKGEGGVEGEREGGGTAVGCGCPCNTAEVK